MGDVRVELNDEGFFVCADVLATAECERLLDALPNSGVAGTRTLMEISIFSDLATELRSRDPLNCVLSELVAVQCTLFQKSTDRNWALGLHRDDVVAISGEGEWPSVGIKEGLPCVRVPRAVLKTFLAVRLNLDPAGEGDLQVVPGSHRHDAAASRDSAVVLHVARGGALAMRPSLLHGSSKLRSTSVRRVLHYLFAPPACLPTGYRWWHAA
jgi:Phytanoyl-CoA dioxygenase (PhyH)